MCYRGHSLTCIYVGMNLVWPKRVSVLGRTWQCSPASSTYSITKCTISSPFAMQNNRRHHQQQQRKWRERTASSKAKKKRLYATTNLANALFCCFCRPWGWGSCERNRQLQWHTLVHRLLFCVQNERNSKWWKWMVHTADLEMVAFSFRRCCASGFLIDFFFQFSLGNVRNASCYRPSFGQA